MHHTPICKFQQSLTTPDQSKPVLDPDHGAGDIKLIEQAATGITLVKLPFEVAISQRQTNSVEFISDPCKSLPGQFGITGAHIEEIGHIPFPGQVDLAPDTDDPVPGIAGI